MVRIKTNTTMKCTKETLKCIEEYVATGTPFYYVAEEFTIKFSGTEYTLKDKSDSREDVILFSGELLMLYLHCLTPKRWSQRHGRVSLSSKFISRYFEKPWSL